jgi:hypothetical protein
MPAIVLQAEIVPTRKAPIRSFAIRLFIAVSP